MTEHKIPWRATTPEFDDGWGEDEDVQEAPDILTTMFEQQRAHMVEYAKITGEENATADNMTFRLDSPRVQARIREFWSYAVEEGYEAINHLKNKPWKQTVVNTDEVKFRKEIGDMWHFLIEAHIIAGMTAEDVFDAYFGETVKNIERQQNGY